MYIHVKFNVPLNSFIARDMTNTVIYLLLLLFINALLIIEVVNNRNIPHSSVFRTNELWTTLKHDIFILQSETLLN